MVLLDASGSAPYDVNPYVSTLFFFVVTSIYCAICMFVKDTHTRLILKVCYILFVVIGEYFINLNLSESVCGVRQWNNAFFITFVPWTLIFGVLHMFLYIFPGWYRPFYNTFGYIVIKLMGLSELMKIIVADPVTVSSASNDIDKAETLRAIESVRSDNALIINELFIPDDDAERSEFKKAVGKLVNAGVFSQLAILEDNLNKLYGFIVMKNTISEYVWNIMTGFLVTSVTYNFIINADCQKSPEQIQASLVTYEEKRNEAIAEDAEAEKKEPKYS